jgi:hypothetical protein
MHRALSGLEVLLEIFTHVKPIDDWYPSWSGDIKSTRKSFEVLARTCKTFHEPAMDLLWAAMGDLGIKP